VLFLFSSRRVVVPKRQVVYGDRGNFKISLSPEAENAVRRQAAQAQRGVVSLPVNLPQNVRTVLQKLAMDTDDPIAPVRLVAEELEKIEDSPIKIKFQTLAVGYAVTVGCIPAATFLANCANIGAQRPTRAMVNVTTSPVSMDEDHGTCTFTFSINIVLVSPYFRA